MATVSQLVSLSHLILSDWRSWRQSATLHIFVLPYSFRVLPLLVVSENTRHAKRKKIINNN